MNFLKSYDWRAALVQFWRYGLASIVSYSIIFGGSYVLTEFAGLVANLSYLISLSVSYVFLYLISQPFIFRNNISEHRIDRFLVHIITFWLANNLVFNAIFYNSQIHYLLIAAINIAIFAPLRFLSLRHFVWVSKNINPNS